MSGRMLLNLNLLQANVVSEECNIRVGSEDTFDAGKNILSIVSSVNDMIGWMVINLISLEANVVREECNIRVGSEDTF